MSSDSRRKCQEEKRSIFELVTPLSTSRRRETARSPYSRDTLHALLAQVPRTVRRVQVVDLRPGPKLLRLLERVHLLSDVGVLVVALAALGLEPALAPLELDPVVVRVVVRAARAEAAVFERHFDFLCHQDLRHVYVLKHGPEHRQ